MKPIKILLVLLTLLSGKMIVAQATNNDYTWYNNGADVTMQAGCLVTVEGDMTNNGNSQPVTHLANNGFLLVYGSLYGDDAFQQRGTGTVRLQNNQSLLYNGRYQVINGGYRVRGNQAATGVDDGSFYNLELANDQGLVYIKSMNADVRNSVNFKAGATTTIIDGNTISVGGAAGSLLNQLLTYDPGTTLTLNPPPANGSNYTTVFGMMNPAPGMANYLGVNSGLETATATGAGYIQGKHRRAILATGGSNYGFPLGLEETVIANDARGLQYIKFSYPGSNTYDVVTGYFQKASSNQLNNFTTDCNAIVQTWCGVPHGEFVFTQSGNNTGSYSAVMFPKKYVCAANKNMVMTKNDLTPQKSGLVADACGLSTALGLTQTYPGGYADFGFAGGQVLLPLQLISFSGAIENNTGVLRWNTANEANMDHFEVAKSPDGRNWNVLASLPARNTISAAYQLTDPALQGGNNYYRLHSKSRDGGSSISNIVLLRLAKSATIVAYPNPASEILTITLGSITKTNGTLYNEAGQIAWTGKLINGTNTIWVAAFSNGSYNLRVNDGNAVHYQKIIINH